MKTLIVLLVTLYVFKTGHSDKKYGRTCEDIGCAGNEECVMARTPCSVYTRNGQCGSLRDTVAFDTLRQYYIACVASVIAYGIVGRIIMRRKNIFIAETYTKMHVTFKSPRFVYPKCQRVLITIRSCETCICAPNKKCIDDRGVPRCVDDVKEYTHSNVDPNNAGSYLDLGFPGNNSGSGYPGNNSDIDSWRRPGSGNRPILGGTPGTGNTPGSGNSPGHGNSTGSAYPGNSSNSNQGLFCLLLSYLTNRMFLP